MRIREDGKHAHRTDTIEQAAEFWDCNKTKALMRSAEFSWRINNQIQKVLERNDLTVQQKLEIADTLSILNMYEIRYKDTTNIQK